MPYKKLKVAFLTKVKILFNHRELQTNSNGIKEIYTDTITLPTNKAIAGKLQGESILIKKGGSVILVYQMGKVGSSSIYRALEAPEIGLPVYHIHYLSEKRLRMSIAWHEQNDFPYMVDHLVISSALNDILREEKDNVHWKIISLSRDPVSWQASAIFENLQQAHSEIIDQNSDSIDMEKAKRLVEKQLNQHITNEYHFLNWFDSEIKAVFGIDIYDYPFNKDRGYKIISKNNVDILLIKLEKLKACFEKAMFDFLGTKNIRLQHANVGAEKKYGDDYTKFTHHLKIDKKLFDNIYSTKLVRHFYTCEEIEQFKKKWT